MDVVYCVLYRAIVSGRHDYIVYADAVDCVHKKGVLTV